jgi:hypothetical protein
MICIDKILALRNPCFWFCLEADNCLTVYACRRQQLAPWQKADHFIPPFHDSDEFARLACQAGPCLEVYRRRSCHYPEESFSGFSVPLRAIHWDILRDVYSLTVVPEAPDIL